MDTSWRRHLARSLSTVENRSPGWRELLAKCNAGVSEALVIGVTGPPGAGKSTLIDALAKDWAERGHRVGIIAIDPASPFSGGAMLGDRVRMRRSEVHDSIFIRSVSARGHAGGLSEAALDLCSVLASFGLTRILLETVGVGQNEVEVAFVADCTLVLSVPGLGDSMQAAKAGLMEVGDVYVVNKADLPGAATVARDLADMLALVFDGPPGRNVAMPDSSVIPAAAGTAREMLVERYGDPSGVAGFWHPPVLTAVATDDPTVAGVVEAIEDCARWLDDSGQRCMRRMARSRLHLRNILRSRLLETHVRAAETAGEPFEQWARSVAEQRLDAHSAAEAMLRLVHGRAAEDWMEHKDAKSDTPATGVTEGTAPSRIARHHVRWLEQSYVPAIRLTPERRTFEVDTGEIVEPLYSPKSLEDIGFDFEADVGFPGEYPFTRGDSTTMFRTEPFVVSAYSGHGEAVECNRRLRKLLDLGVEQILLALDLPTQCGYDSDDVMAAGEVGRAGVSIDTLADMELLFEGIPLNSLKRVGTLGNSIGPIVLAMFAILGEKQGLGWNDYVVNLQNDPLKEYLARGTQILPAAPAAKLAVDPVAWCSQNAPSWSPLTVCYNHLNAGGAGSTWGAALALGNAIHYLDLLVAQGYPIDEIAPLFHMFPDERHDFFVSIANLRSLRRVWARLMKERYGATDRNALALKTTVYGHGQETLQEPLNNIVRIGFGTLAYVLGGANYVYIASYDEAVGTPTEETVRVAIRTQQIIAHEHGFTDTIDPLGGSYFLETLTKKTANDIWEHLKQVEKVGGALHVIEDGFGREIMNRGAQRRQQRIDRGDRPWVTVNKWPQTPNVPNTAFRMDPSTVERQHERTARIRRERDNELVEQALAAIDRACSNGENMVPPTMDAVRAYATVGEIAERWRRNFGAFEPSASF